MMDYVIAGIATLGAWLGTAISTTLVLYLLVQLLPLTTTGFVVAQTVAVGLAGVCATLAAIFVWCHWGELQLR